MSIYNNNTYIYLRVDLDCLSNSCLANRTRWRFFFTDFVGTLHAEEIVAAGDQGRNDFVLEAYHAVVLSSRLGGRAGGGAAVGRGIAVGTVRKSGDVDGKAGLVARARGVAPHSPSQGVLQAFREGGRQARSGWLAPSALGFDVTRRVATKAGERVYGFERGPNGLGRRR